MNADFSPTLFAGRRYALLGLGRNGAPAARALAAMGAQVQAWDDGAAGRGGLDDARVRLAPFEDLAGYDALVLSPGIPHRLPAPHPVAAMALAAGVPVLSDAELLFEAVRASGSRARFAGVTGTNGKSTTTALLAHILTVAGIPNAAGGNLGPASLALPPLGDDGVYVLEMSSYMLERLATLRFDAACLLNLSPDHLDRHGDMAGYVAAKCRIFDRQGADDVAVVGLDDAPSRLVASGRFAARLVTIMGDDAGALAGAIAGATALPGSHNAQNALAAAAMAAHLGAERAAIARAIGSFPGLPHRQRRIARIGGIELVDDSKATNADAASRALGCYERLIWIAGGLAKSGGIEMLAPHFARIPLTLLIGRDAPAFAGTLARHGAPHRIVGTLDEAVPQALDAARTLRAPVVLLSPAAASFDQFASFERRGERFAELAAGLEGAR